MKFTKHEKELGSNVIHSRVEVLELELETMARNGVDKTYPMAYYFLHERIVRLKAIYNKLDG